MKLKLTRMIKNHDGKRGRRECDTANHDVEWELKPVPEDGVVVITDAGNYRVRESDLLYAVMNLFFKEHGND